LNAKNVLRHLPPELCSVAPFVVKPFEVGRLTELVRERVLNRKRNKRLDKERVGAILQRCVSDSPQVPAEISFNFQNNTGQLFLRILSFISE